MSVLLLLALSAATPAEKSATCDAKPFTFGTTKTASVAPKPFTFGTTKTASVAPKPPPPPKPAPPPKPVRSTAGIAPCKTPPK